MIHRNQKTLNRLNVLSDGVLIVLCYLFASWLWLDVIRNTKGNMAALSSLNARGILAAVIYAIWTVFLLSLLRVYHTSRVHRAGRESGRIVAGNAIALATAASALFVFRLQDFSRGVLAVYFLSSSAVLIGKRKILRFLLRCMRARGYNLKHMLVVGGGKLAERYVQNVKAEPSLGIHVEQCLIPSEGMLEKLESRLHGAGIDEVILALAPDELRVTADVIQVCEKCGTKISVVPFYNDVIPTRPTIDTVGNLKLIQLRTTPLEFYRSIVPADYAPDSYIMIMNDPTREYYKVYEIRNYRNTYEGVNWVYLNLPNEAIKRAAIASIKAGEAMYASCDVADYDPVSGVCDPAMYDYGSMFGIDLAMDKKARILTRQSGSAHAMALIAVDTDDNDVPLKWQFENSWGPSAGHEGYMTFTDEWFDEYMFRIVINRKYLDAKSLEAAGTKPEQLPAWDYMF